MADPVTLRVPMAEIHVDQDLNCGRGKILPHTCLELAESIKQQGLMEPVILRLYSADKQSQTGKKYGLVAGYRRHMAHLILKAEDILATVHEDVDDVRARIMNLTENLHRDDLTIYQEAHAIEPLVKMMTRVQLEKSLGKTTQWVQERQYLLTLPEDIQLEFHAGTIQKQYIRELYKLRGDTNKQYEAVRAIKEARLRGARGLILAKPTNPNARKIRQKQEILEFQSRIQDMVGNNIGTRCLGWAAGLVSDNEVLEDLKTLEKMPSLSKLRNMRDFVLGTVGDGPAAKLLDWILGECEEYDLKEALEEAECKG